MKPIKIITDSCSDITNKFKTEYDIASINFTIYFEEHEISADPWVEITPEFLYDTLRMGTRVYTLPATEYEINKNFHQYAKDYDIVYVAACEKQSTTVLKAKRIADAIMYSNPDYRIEVVDSLNASIGQLLVVLEACRLRDLGLTVDELLERLLPFRKHVVQFATVETLTYLSKANKINARSEIMGNFLDLKPILVSDIHGNQTSMKNIRGREQSLLGIIDMFLENLEHPEDQEIYIIHGDDEETAEYVRDELIARKLVCKKINIFCVGPVVGITVGPGMIGLFGIGKEVTFDSENVK